MPDSLFTAMTRAETWDSQALCRTASDVDVFFPATESPAAVAWVSSRYCDHCPVRAQCLDQAIASQGEGLWAGTTTAERRKLTRTRNRQRCPLCTSENRIFVREIGDGPDHELCLACGVSWAVNEGPGSPAWTAKYPPSWKRGTYDASTGQIANVPTLDGVL